MAERKNVITETYEAAADLSGKLYHVMRASDAGKCNQGSLNTDINLIGVLDNEPESGQHASVVVGGERMKVTAGAAITAETPITSNGSGRAIAVQSGTNQVVIGWALEDAGADGDIISYRPVKPYPWPGVAI